MSNPLARIIVTGASGNVGSGVLRALAKQVPDAEVVGVCRRPPTHGTLYERIRWHAIDLADPNAAAALAPVMRDADVVVHLALSVQPVRDEDYLYRANVLGSRAVLAALVEAGVPQLVYASSLGIYAPGASGPVAEDWSDAGQSTSVYSRHKVAVERMLDEFVAEHPDVTVARFRPTVVVQREAAWLIRTLYLGPLVPQALLEVLRRRQWPLLPLPAGVRLQFVHADDVGDAVIRLMLQRAHGSFNVAADVLDAEALGQLVGARVVSVPPRAVRAAVSAANAARLIAMTPGWYDVAFNTPVMETGKARTELGWTPTHSSVDSARELIDGLADGAVGDSPATGSAAPPRRSLEPALRRAHDASLLAWTGLAVARALRVGHTGPAIWIAAGVNLFAGTPAALRRVLDRRRDAAAVLAPPAVLAALVSTWRGGWAPVAATAVLHLLNVGEKRRARR